MRVGAIQTDTGVEMKLPTTETRSLLRQPVEQLPAVAGAPGVGMCRKVVDVEVMAPSQVVADAEPRDRLRMLVRPGEHTHQSIALGPLDFVHAVHESRLVGVVGPQRLHRRKR